MVIRRLYTQLILVFAVSLFVFAGAAAVLWKSTGHIQSEIDLFQKTTALTVLLLPEANADATEQAAAVKSVGESLDIDITLWSPTGELLGATGQPAEFPSLPLQSDTWVPAKGQTEWATQLPDGRVVVITLDRLSVPDDAVGFGLSLFLLALFIAAVSYPFIRRITKRLELLQDQVLQIGSGDLAARVDVEGHDEVAVLAASFNRSAEQIEALVNAQRMLLANASHELRTPLARIRLGVELLQTKDDPERRRSLQNDIKELDELIDELILMTKLDTGSQDKQFERVDLVGLAAEESARYHDCLVTGTANGDILGDRRMLRHLIRNLIDNAFSHGKAPVKVDVTEQDGRTRLTVTDAGDGIPEGERQKVFEPFYRAAGKQNINGHGLGLPLVQRIATVHGAKITIENDPVSSISIVFCHQDAR